MTSNSAGLESVGILEKDTSGDVIFAWMFPEIDKSIRPILIDRSGLKDDIISCPFRFGKVGNTWHYTLSAPINDSSNAKLMAVSIVLNSSVFNPEKYRTLLKILAKTYLDNSGNAVPLMETYLSVVTTGVAKSQYGVYDESSFDNRRALIAPLDGNVLIRVVLCSWYSFASLLTALPSFILLSLFSFTNPPLSLLSLYICPTNPTLPPGIFDRFGVEVVLIWAAMLLKKRVFVFSSDLSELLSNVRVFPLIGSWHRMDWSILRPHMILNDDNLSDISSLGVYVAGFTDPNAASKSDMFDLFVDLDNDSITVANHAKPDFMLAKFHKEMTTQFLEKAEEGSTQAVVKFIASKTKELLDQLEGLKTDNEDGSYITREGIEEKGLSLNMARFLFNVALAENMTVGQ